MKEKTWSNKDLEQLYKNNHDYIQKALLNYCNALLLEQKERIEQMEGQLDGTMWNHAKWD